MDDEPRVLVGCPVAHRAWVLDCWFDHVEAAADRVGLEPGFVFVGDEHDEQTMNIIEKRTSGRFVIQVYAPNRKGADFRDWHKPEAISHMVDLRNRLLKAVRMARPTYFLSLDSDILLHPLALEHLIDDVQIDHWDAVGGRCYMTATGNRYPSWGNEGRQGQIVRSDADGYFGVQIIMAIKLMTRSAYEINYEFDRNGEDVGWSRACRQAGLRLAWDGRVSSKHVLKPHLLHHLDPRVGY